MVVACVALCGLSVAYGSGLCGIVWTVSGVW